MDKILSKALVKYGIQLQSIVAIEELAELQKEIAKAVRGQLDKAHLIEELADVKIVTEQIKMYYSVSDSDVDKVVHQKVNRLKDRMENE